MSLLLWLLYSGRHDVCLRLQIPVIHTWQQRLYKAVQDALYPPVVALRHQTVKDAEYWAESMQGWRTKDENVVWHHRATQQPSYAQVCMVVRFPWHSRLLVVRSRAHHLHTMVANAQLVAMDHAGLHPVLEFLVKVPVLKREWATQVVNRCARAQVGALCCTLVP